MTTEKSIVSSLLMADRWKDRYRKPKIKKNKHHSGLIIGLIENIGIYFNSLPTNKNCSIYWLQIK